uniref:Uncharacterized protein n=1 Tax=Anguilla anguilla TaxID=7936 RepID=A0A0E9VRV1_ANGAN
MHCRISRLVPGGVRSYLVFFGWGTCCSS